jgi:S-adenosylmethionine:tRNA ribosyltransferase-isomerase
LRDRSLIVLNDTRVIQARLRGKKTPSGGAVEVLLVRPASGDALPRGTPPWIEEWEVLARSLGASAPGARLVFDPALEAEVIERGERGEARMRFHGREGENLVSLAERIGVLPLPPYIEAARKRAAESGAPEEIGAELDDRLRYQTVYGARPGAVAAPTAGLHFTPALLEALRAAGHEIATVTLHVGPGTFRPVEVEDPAQHRMDSESYEVSEGAAAAIERARAEGRPIVAVGTTVVRTLESLGAEGRPVRPGRGSTTLFLKPGDRFFVVTDLVTNFHLPRSTLLMLVSAFAARERLLAAYEEAIERGYRFYSYGDAMFIRSGAAP